MINLRAFNITADRSNEQVLMIVRRHWFNIISQFFFIFLMVGLLVGNHLLLPTIFPALATAEFSGLFLFLEDTFAVFIWLFFFLIWIDYYFDVWIITDRRIINIEQKGLFCREVSELHFDKIQDVTTEVLGIIPTFLNYGNVYVQTAAEKERFCFRNVPDPYHIKDTIVKIQRQQEKQDTAEFAKMIEGKN